MISVPSRLVSTQWLEDNIESPKIRLLDASWYLPNEDRDAYSEYLKNHISGANFFDIDAFSDPDSVLPHMAPSVERFGLEVSKLGINKSDQVVIYDGAGLFSAARAWWLFELFGVCNTCILDGGLPKWVSEGRSLESKIKRNLGTSDIVPKMRHSWLCDWRQVKKLAEEDPKQIVDARSKDRFHGRAPEPRPGLRSGHIPKTTNICFQELLNDDKSLKNRVALKRIFYAKGVNLEKQIITSCGSGVTAAILAFALYLLGAKNVALYDGSWCEWGARYDLDVET